MCRRLLEDTGVAILPGGDFGCSPEELTARLAYVDFNGKAAIEALEGPFDFVFSDADKHWYKNYLIALLPKLEVGGCYTTHNMSSRRRGLRGGGRSGSYLDYLYSLPNLKTTVDDRGAGLSISYKKSQ